MATRLKGFLSETLFYGLAGVFSRFFAFFLIPIYIHQLGSAQYANIILLQLTFTIGSYFFALNSGVFFYYYDWNREKLRRSIFSSWVYYQLFIFLCAAIAFFVFQNFLKSLLDLSNFGPNKEAIAQKALLFTLLQFLPFLISNTFYNYCRIRLQARNVMLATVGEAVFTLLFTLLFIFKMKMSIEGVMLGQLCDRGVISIIVLFNRGYRTFFIPAYASFKIAVKLFTYSWPYLLISIFTWVISSVDKFIGTHLLSSYTDVAHVSLANQIVLPVSIMVDVIRQAYGPYVMNIKHEKDSTKTYSNLFSLIFFLAVLCSGVVIMASPLLMRLLSNDSFFTSLKLVPLFALAMVINITITQFGIGCNLKKKNGFIAVAALVGGLVGFFCNWWLQPILGITATGIAQVISFFITALLVWYFSSKYLKVHYEVRWILIISFLFISQIILTLLAYWYQIHLTYTYLSIGLITLSILLWFGNQRYKLVTVLINQIKKRLPA